MAINSSFAFKKYQSSIVPCAVRVILRGGCLDSSDKCLLKHHVKLCKILLELNFAKFFV